MFRRRNTANPTTDPAQPQVPKWRRVLLNKYLVVTLFCLVFFIFLDSTNLIVTTRLQHKVRTLHREEQRLKDEIAADSIRVGRLVGNLEELERFGREEYYMKRVDEDIYVINDEEE